MNEETVELQLDTLSQAVELLLQHVEERVSPEEAKRLGTLRDELLRLRTERGETGGAVLPESLHPPLESVRSASGDDDADLRPEQI